MSFDRLLTDTITLLKQNGETVEQIKASVQKNKIFIQRSDLIIKSGDLIRRVMSNGAEETFKIIDPGFHESFHSIPAGYQMDVIKLGLPEAKNAVHTINYNISGTNNRINQNSTDNSVNTLNLNPDLQKHLTELRKEIKSLNLDKDEKSATHEILNEVENQLNNQKPNKTIVRTLLDGLPSVGNIATIASLIVSLLG
jgi:hypothetical protein